MKWFLGMALGGALAGCGADGEPVQPTRNATVPLSGTHQQPSTYQPGVHVSGHVNIGVAKGI
ncbi:hypothetical protein HKX54_00090 [Sulfitobacter sp. M57]|uniref:hypothetical protein n=1 Tax=unclassified Sulfitobacter TaxID=196795 RepID=UPI0023E14681|nr:MULTISPECIES: hypothetical protein [unclassified Sulfitobacter]MDF3412841.1 hypothetical protein [Sulfitobacter sp. KE5]MDF3421875.1 hypothetical protein [Sulfitobacter sp. KE43]MDF3431390.1 hypothetical protein [Sulfitobacter sp. KE42]MDF3457031.1 hypothetical protein [Sulfitobacter sp. S74]MDF3460934.1 hypothetical protein [Sulfitobacter sp. Ks18]